MAEQLTAEQEEEEARIFVWSVEPGHSDDEIRKALGFAVGKDVGGERLVVFDCSKWVDTESMKNDMTAAFPNLDPTILKEEFMETPHCVIMRGAAVSTESVEHSTLFLVSFLYTLDLDANSGSAAFVLEGWKSEFVWMALPQGQAKLPVRKLAIPTSVGGKRRSGADSRTPKRRKVAETKEVPKEVPEAEMVPMPTSPRLREWLTGWLSKKEEEKKEEPKDEEVEETPRGWFTTCTIS